MFLTQDATPVGDEWLARARRAARRRRRGSASRSGRTCRGPDTSPMIARELTEFFGSFGTDGVRLDDERATPADAASGFFSNVNSAVLRDVLGGGPLPRRRIRRGPGVRARRDGGRVAQGVRPGRRRAARARLPVRREFMRRYFDEYRGLRETDRPRRAARPGARSTSRAQVRGGRRATCAQPGSRARQTLAWARSLAAPPRRARGVRLARLARRPAGPRLRRRLSLEGRDEAPRRPRRPRSRTRTVRPYFTEPAAPLAAALAARRDRAVSCTSPG